MSEFYTKRLILLTLPPEIGLPVPSSPFIETPPLVWQTFLYIDIFRHASRGNIVSYTNIYNAFRLKMMQQRITVRRPPLSAGGHYSDALKEYLTLLVKISTLRKVEGNRYQVLRPFKIPDSVEDQVNVEKLFYQKHQETIINGLTY